MRIALVHYAAPPVIGGVERVIEQHARLLTANGHEVVVICGNPQAHIDGAGIHVLVVDWSEASVRAALQGCDLMVVHNMFTMPFHDAAAAVLAKFSHEYPTINWVHDVDVSAEWFSALQLKARHVAVSEVRRDLFLQVTGVPEDQCIVIPNGVDIAGTLGLTQPVRNLVIQHSLFERGMIIFHPTRILKRKNIELGIEVTASLKAAGVNVAYVISGAPDPHRASSADYARAVKQLVTQRDLKKSVIFAGETQVLNEADVRSFYTLADVIFFPSHVEGFGLPLLEAALHRTPLMCSDIPVHREVLGDEGHFFSLDAESDQIAQSLRDLLQKNGLSRAQRMVRENRSWERIYHVYLEPLLKGV